MMTRESLKDMLEAEVVCKVGHKKWVAWDDRHEGRAMTSPGYYRVRCGPCPEGSDQMRYTGRMRSKGDGK